MLMEKPSRLRKHERIHGVNPHVREYRERLGAPLFTMSDGREVRLADPVEHGYRVDEPPSELGGIPIRMSLTDGVPIVGDCGPYDLAENMDVIDGRTDGVGWPE